MPKIIYSTDESDEESANVVKKKEKHKKVDRDVKQERLKFKSYDDEVPGSSGAVADVQQPKTGAMVINFSDFDGETLRKALELLEQGRLAAAREKKVSDASAVVTKTSTKPSSASLKSSSFSSKVEKKQQQERSHCGTSLVHKSKVKKEEKEEKKEKKMTANSIKRKETEKHKAKTKLKIKKDGVLRTVKVESGSVNESPPRHLENKKKKISSSSSLKSSANNINCSDDIKANVVKSESKSDNIEAKVTNICLDVEKEKDFASDDDEWNVDISVLCDSIDVSEVQIEEVADVPVKELADVQVGEVADVHVEEVADVHVEEVADGQVDEVADVHVEEVADGQVDEVADVHVEEVADDQVDEVADVHVEEVQIDNGNEVKVYESASDRKERDYSEVATLHQLCTGKLERMSQQNKEESSKSNIESKVMDSAAVVLSSVEEEKGEISQVCPMDIDVVSEVRDRSEEVVSIRTTKIKDSKEGRSLVSAKMDQNNGPSTSKKKHSSMHKKHDKLKHHHHHHSSSSKLVASNKLVSATTLPPIPSSNKLLTKDDSVMPVHRQTTDSHISCIWRAKDVKLQMTPYVILKVLHPLVLRRLEKRRFVKICSNQSNVTNDVRNNVQLVSIKGDRKEGKRIDSKRNNISEKERDRRIEKTKDREERTLKEKVREEKTENVNSREERMEVERIRDERTKNERVTEEKIETDRIRVEGTEKLKLLEETEEKKIVIQERTGIDRLQEEERTEQNERLQEEKTSKERLREGKTEKEVSQEQRAGKERSREQKIHKEKSREQRAEKERLQNNCLENERLPVNRTENDRLRDNSLDTDKKKVNKLDNDKVREERNRDQEECRKKRPWRSSIPADKGGTSEKQEHVKKRRIVRPFKATDDLSSKHDTKSSSPKKLQSVPPRKESVTIEEKGPHDMYISSFDACSSMKEDITGDNFLMDGIETDGLESTSSALATDDVLLQARQVGQPTTDFSQLLNCSVVASETKAVDFEDCLSGEEMLSTWNTCTDASSSLLVGEVNSQACNKQEAEIILVEESSMKEYENYLDDCDFRGEMPTEKIDKSSDPCPDDLYKGTPKNQLEELKVQINGVSAGFVNHSPVKLSPHNVMLSSSVCNVSASVNTSNEVDVDVVEIIDCVQSTSTMGKLLLPVVDNEQANSNASVDSKNNLAAAPFAMTTDLDVAAPLVEEQNASVRDDVDANSENSYNSQCSNASMQKETVFATNRDTAAHENNVNLTSEMDSVWSFKKKQDVVVNKEPDESSKNVASKTPTKQVQKTPKPLKSVQLKEHKSIVSSLSIRIAKELGTNVPDVDTLSIMAPSSDEDSLLGDDLEEKSPDKTGDLFDNSNMSVSISSDPLSVSRNESRRRAAPGTDISSERDLISDLQRMKNADLIERFGRDVRAGNHNIAIKIFGVLQSKVIEPRKYNMIRDLLQAIVNTERKLDVGLVNELFQTVVRLVPSYNGNVRSQIQLLRFMFSIFKKNHHIPTSVHNYLRANEDERGDSPGIVQTYNKVLREAIYLQYAEVLHLYRDATEVGIEIEETSLRSLLIIFHRDRLTHYALDLYNMGCCMGIYPTLRIREWPHCLRLKTFYSENELEIMIRDFFHKLAINFRTNPRFYDPRAINREEKFTVYLYLEELQYQKADKGGVLDMIDCSLEAAIKRVANVVVGKIDKTLALYVRSPEEGRIICIKADGTIQLMTLLLDASQNRKSSHSSINFNHTVSESSIEMNPFKTET